MLSEVVNDVFCIFVFTMNIVVHGPVSVCISNIVAIVWSGLL